MSHTHFLVLASWKHLIGIGSNIGCLIMFTDLILFIRNIQTKDLHRSLRLSPCDPRDSHPYRYADKFVLWVILLVSDYGRVNIRSILAGELELYISESEGGFLAERKADEFFVTLIWATDSTWIMWGSLAWLFLTDYWSSTSGYFRNQIRCFFIALLRQAWTVSDDKSWFSNHWRIDSQQVLATLETVELNL